MILPFCHLFATARRELLESETPIQHCSKTEISHARAPGNQQPLKR